MGWGEEVFKERGEGMKIERCLLLKVDTGRWEKEEREEDIKT